MDIIKDYEENGIFMLKYYRYIFICKRINKLQVETIGIIPNVNNKSNDRNKKCDHCESFIKNPEKMSNDEWVTRCNRYAKCQKNMIRGIIQIFFLILSKKKKYIL